MNSDTPVEMVIAPQTIVIIAAALGAAVLGLAFFYWRKHLLAGVLGTALGALGGGAGSLIFMAPLDYCTFEAERTRNDRIIGVFLIGIGMLVVLTALGWVGERLLRGQSLIATQQIPGVFRMGWLKSWLVAMALLAPTLGILGYFLYYPSYETLHLSTQLSKMGARREIFRCVDNYTLLVSERSDYLEVVQRTMWITLAIVVLSMVIALAIATMAHLPLRGANIYRTLLIWPYAISPAVIGVIFLLMFNPSGGIINHFSGDILGIRVGWLNDPKVAPWTVIMASVWKSLGFNILFYIAALQNVPKDLIEAAAIDGANAIQRFRRIVVPLLSPTTLFLTVTNLTYAFFDTYATIDYVTPGGGPLESTTTMMYRVIQVGVDDSDLGKAAAQSIVLFLTVIAITLVLFRSGENRVTYGA